MAITLSAAAQTAARNAACDAIVGLLDVGGTGTFELQTAGSVEVATLTCSATAFGAASSGVATANTITNDSAATGNASPVTRFEAKNGGGTVVWDGTVGESGADMNFTDAAVDGNVIIPTNSVVSLTPPTFTVN
ncbi:MAG: hypothetical protein AAGJ50_13515, partial [Pseudomonadota bacterium]